MFLWNEHERRIRALWLIFSIACTGCSVIFEILPVLLSQTGNPFLWITISSSLVALFLLYHFAYKNAGTRFLTYMMYAKLLGCMDMIGGLYIDPVQGFEILSNCFTAIELFLALAWLTLSFHLRKINMKNKQSLLLKA